MKRLRIMSMHLFLRDESGRNGGLRVDCGGRYRDEA
jgi:hypothetical protein